MVRKTSMLIVSAMVVFVSRPHASMAMRTRNFFSAFASAPSDVSFRNRETFRILLLGRRRTFGTSSSSSSSKRRTPRSPSSLGLQSTSVGRPSSRPSFISPSKRPSMGTSATAPAADRRPPKLYGRRSGGTRSNGDEAATEYRADRVLANRTGKSRSECFDLLQQRRVSYLDASTPTTGGSDGSTLTSAAPQQWRRVPGPKHKLSMDAPLRIDGTTVVPLPPPPLLVYHKPKWVLSVRSDPREGRPCLDANRLAKSGVTPEVAASGALHAVGRLDYDSSGLLLLSSNGTLTQRILHPKHEIPKEYTAVVTGRVDEAQLSRQLTEGVTTAEGVHTAQLLSCRVWDDGEVPPYLESVRHGLPPHYNQTDLDSKGYFDVLRATELSTVTLVVCEGKHRMVRRMLANCGHPVVDLTRHRIGSIELGNVKVGSVRDLTKDELAWARALLKDR